ncbi:MAG: nucleoside-diphosphate kinase [Hyphomicrobiales bacterium]
MTAEACILTTKDFTILEVMHERCLGRDDPLAPVLKRKLESATVTFREDVPADVATLSSRVTYSVNGRDPDTRVLSQERMTSPVGMFLPITTLRGLALMGLSEGEEFVLTDDEGCEIRVRLNTVHYQPEAAKREKEALPRVSLAPARKPALRLIRGGTFDQPRLATAAVAGPEDPGPSAA